MITVRFTDQQFGTVMAALSDRAEYLDANGKTDYEEAEWVEATANVDGAHDAMMRAIGVMNASPLSWRR